VAVEQWCCGRVTVEKRRQRRNSSAAVLKLRRRGKVREGGTVRADGGRVPLIGAEGGAAGALMWRNGRFNGSEMVRPYERDLFYGV
jgi:hypothetical protein